MRSRLYIPLALVLTWPTSAEAQLPNWSDEGLEQVAERLDEIGSAAFIVMSGHEVVLSWGRTETPFRMHSIRKSLLSALVGVSVARGELSLSSSLAELGINDKGLLTPAEQTATVEHLLASRSGVYHPAASETREARALRPTRGAFEPGQRWYYNNWDFNTLGTIFASARGQTVGDAFRDHLAQPLGFRDFDVERDFEYHLEPHHSRHPSYRFRLTARDLVRFGRLYLGQGRWEGAEIVPGEWVERSTRATSVMESDGTKGGYGFMWWVSGAEDPVIPDGSFTASGAGGQRLTVLPSLNTVVVHLMDTEAEGGPRIGSEAYDSLLRLLLAARVR
ncbi:MAG: serine hydrolase [Gemmatimonadota bacterium]